MDIDDKLVDQVVIVRGRCHTKRGKGKIIFIKMRHQIHTIQCCLSVSEIISKGMVDFASKVSNESIIEVVAKVVVPDKEIDSCSQKVELQV